MGARVLLLCATLATALVLGACSSRHERAAKPRATHPSPHRAASTTGLPVVLALDRLPKSRGGLSVDADRAAVGFIGPTRTMIAAVPMGAGGNYLDVGLFRVADGHPVFVSDLTLDGNVESVHINGGRLIVETAAFRGSDRLCCPSGTRTWTYGMVRNQPVLFETNVAWKPVPTPAPRKAPPKATPTPKPTAKPTAKPTPTPTATAKAAVRTPAPPRRVSAQARKRAPPVHCNATTIYGIASDGSVIDTADGMVYHIAAADQSMAASWLRGQGVLVCTNHRIVNEDAHGTHVSVAPGG